MMLKLCKQVLRVFSNSIKIKKIVFGILGDKTSFCRASHIYRIVLVHFASNIVFKTRKIFRWFDIEFLKILKTQNFVSLPHCLTTLQA